MLKELTIELTQRCPNRCVYCSTEGGPDATTHLDTATVCRVLTEARELGATTAAISGGEPTLHPGLPDILQHGHSLGLKLRLYSCGVSDTYEPLSLDILDTVRATRTQLILGIPSFRASTYRRIARSEATVRQPIDTIERAQSLHLKVEAQHTPLLLTVAQLPTYVECARALKLTQVSLLRFVPQGRGAAARPELELTDGLTQRITAFASGAGVRLGAPFLGAAGCQAASRLLIQPDGRVLPCEALKGVWEPFTLGSVHDAPLQKLWASTSRTTALQALPTAPCPAQQLYST